MTVQDLERIKEEFEQINKVYRQTFSSESRMDLLDRVITLMSAIKGFESLERLSS